MSGRISNKIVTDGLVLYLDAGNPRSFINGATAWNDRTSNNNNGLLINGPSFSSDNGGYISFDGVNDYISFNYTQPGYQTTDSFSWNIWVYPNRNSNLDILMGNRGGGIDFMKLTTSNFEYYPTIISLAMPLNIWQNVCVIKNQTNLFYYRNGVLITSATSSVTKPPNPFYVGGDPVGEISNSRISQVYVYNKALTSSEVIQNYNALKTRFGL